MIFSQELKVILNSSKAVPYLKQMEWFYTQNEHKEIVNFRLSLEKAVNIEQLEEVLQLTAMLLCILHCVLQLCSKDWFNIFFTGTSFEAYNN